MRTICKRRNKEEERKKRQNERKELTLTGLLMEGPSDTILMPPPFAATLPTSQVAHAMQIAIAAERTSTNPEKKIQLIYNPTI